MFWFGLAVTVFAALLGISLIRAGFSKRFPKVTDRRFDVARIVLITVGVVITASEYLGEVERRKYSLIAKLGVNGSEFGPEGDITFHSPLTRAIEGTWEEKTPGRFGAVCTPDAEQKRLDALNAFPDFPFTHLWHGVCHREKGDSDWRPHVARAREIFEITTQIDGHHSHHDDALTHIKDRLK